MNSDRIREKLICLIADKPGITASELAYATQHCPGDRRRQILAGLECQGRIVHRIERSCRGPGRTCYWPTGKEPAQPTPDQAAATIQAELAKLKAAVLSLEAAIAQLTAPAVEGTAA